MAKQPKQQGHVVSLAGLVSRLKTKRLDEISEDLRDRMPPSLVEVWEGLTPEERERQASIIESARDAALWEMWDLLDFLQEEECSLTAHSTSTYREKQSRDARIREVQFQRLVLFKCLYEEELTHDESKTLLTLSESHPGIGKLVGTQISPRRQESAWLIQEQKILQALRGLGYEPAALPPYKPGNGNWIKSEVWALLCDSRKQNERNFFVSETVFKKAWNRLRQAGKIREMDG